jgi:hypothetical protein
VSIDTKTPTFTPGPWMFEGDEVTATDGDVLVADLSLFSSVAADEWQANGRLIAAAPDLYAALKLYVDHYGDPLKVARAALDKAEGR